MTRRIAFFDVDDTLIIGTSLFGFLAHDLAERGCPPDSYRQAIARIRSLDATRTEANRAFFGQFAGREVADLFAIGERWFASPHSAEFDRRVLTMLRSHADRGDLVVLLSGSFLPCLAPIARRVGADVVLCTQPEIADGRYTGAVESPVIGTRKASIAGEFAGSRNVAAADCYAYADDSSDLPILRWVGNPVVVGADPVLLDDARQHGWATIPPRTDPIHPANGAHHHAPIAV